MSLEDGSELYQQYIVTILFVDDLAVVPVQAGPGPAPWPGQYAPHLRRWARTRVS